MPASLSQADRPLLTERDVAELFGVTTRTVRRWAQGGELAPVRIGGVTRYRASEVWALINPENDERPDVTPAARETSIAGTGDRVAP